ncbi:hypothetical protein FQA39_LY14497 [Lamprigera yunnana]|nr:hypothetical protein FQA39_LY14497 [Lamprigera yunnana]
MRFFIAVVLTIHCFHFEEACFSKISYGSSRERKEYVDKHNNLRSQLTKGSVQNLPKAKIMKTMKYDANLEAEAYQISRKCRFEHAVVKDKRWSHVGQNLYMTTGFGNWNSAIQAWFDEYKVYKYPDGPNSATGHFTQIAWATTEYVGCAQSKCIDFKLFVCNYGPGNRNMICCVSRAWSPPTIVSFAWSITAQDTQVVVLHHLTSALGTFTWGLILDHINSIGFNIEEYRLKHRWSHVGQNLYLTTGFGNWNSAIQAWFDEYKVYKYPDGPSSATGHFTQIAWATTEYVGCAQSKCNTFNLFVCNYGPGGNLQGVPPYQT